MIKRILNLSLSAFLSFITKDFGQLRNIVFIVLTSMFLFCVGNGKSNFRNDDANFLQFRIVVPSLANNSETFFSTTLGKDVKVSKDVLLNLNDVERAEAKFNESDKSYKVSITFTHAGRYKFSKITGNNIGKRLATIIDGELQATPTIMIQVDFGRASISFDMSREESETLAAKINGIIARLPDKSHEEEKGKLTIDILSELESLKLDNPYLFEQQHLSQIIHKEERIGSQMQEPTSPEIFKEKFGIEVLPQVIFQRTISEHLKLETTYESSSSDSVVKVAAYEWLLDIKDLRERELAREKVFTLTCGIYDKLKQILESHFGEAQIDDLEIERDQDFGDRIMKGKMSQWSNDKRTVILVVGQSESAAVYVKWK